MGRAAVASLAHDLLGGRGADVGNGRAIGAERGWLLAVVALAVLATATHLPHLPGLLPGLQSSSHGASALVCGSDGSMDRPEWAATSASSEEVWCSVEGVLPAAPHAVLGLLAAGAVVLAVLAATHLARTAAAARTKPPPLVGARLRAALQVYRN